MKHIYFAALGIALMGVAAGSPKAAPSDSSTPPAIATEKGESNTSAAPVAGKNSFTEAEARARLEKYGYTEITDLREDDQSIWRGKAMKDGKSMAVSVDYQGNIVGQ